MNTPVYTPVERQQETAANSIVARTFFWLTGGLVLSGLVAAYVGTNSARYHQFVDNRVLFWIVLLAPFAIILTLGRMLDRLSVASASVLYLAFCFTEGLTLSVIFQAYTASSVEQVFFIAAVMFGVAGTVGFVLNIDLTRFGGILLLALVGLVAATFVNLFWANDQLYWITTYAGVVIFLALTVYDFNIVKRQSTVEMTSDQQTKSALWLAIALFLDFVNLLLFLLRIFGKRN